MHTRVFNLHHIISQSLQPVSLCGHCDRISDKRVDAYSGVGVIRCQSGHKPCHWCVPRPGIQRQPRDSAGDVRGDSRRRFLAARRSRVAAGEVSSCDVGLTHRMGEGRPVCSEFLVVIAALAPTKAVPLTSRTCPFVRWNFFKKFWLTDVSQ